MSVGRPLALPANEWMPSELLNSPWKYNSAPMDIILMDVRTILIFTNSHISPSTTIKPYLQLGSFLVPFTNVQRTWVDGGLQVLSSKTISLNFFAWEIWSFLFWKVPDENCTKCSRQGLSGAMYSQCSCWKCLKNKWIDSLCTQKVWLTFMCQIKTFMSHKWVLSHLSTLHGGLIEYHQTRLWTFCLGR